MKNNTFELFNRTPGATIARRKDIGYQTVPRRRKGSHLKQEYRKYNDPVPTPVISAKNQDIGCPNVQKERPSISIKDDVRCVDKLDIGLRSAPKEEKEGCQTHRMDPGTPEIQGQESPTGQENP